MPDSPGITLFLYGTLCREGSAASLVQDCERIGEATVQGRLYDTGAYPALLLDPDGRSVHGELWRCPAEALHRIDRYEGVEAGLFERVPVVIGGQQCLVYVAGPTLRRRLAAARLVEGGRWRDPCREERRDGPGD